MPVVGERKSKVLGQGYENDPIKAYASSFRDVAKDVLNESQMDVFQEPMKALMDDQGRQTLKKFFCEGVYDPDSMTAEEFDDKQQMLEAQFENDVECIGESTALGAFNPVIGMVFPVQKNILMNMIFDKGAIPKSVAVSPKFTISLETRYLVKPDGTKIDMFKQQNEMTAAIDSSNPFVEIPLTLPERGTTDILTAMGASSMDNLSIRTFVSAVQVELKYKAGDALPDGTTAASDTTALTWLPVSFEFGSGYGDQDQRTLVKSFTLPTTASAYVAGSVTTDQLYATMRDNRFTASSGGIIKGIKVNCIKDSSNGMLRTCSVKWGLKTDLIEIPENIPIDTTVSPEEVKDIAALYNVNQLTKLMSMFKLALGNYKDDKILQFLNDSYLRLDDTQKIQASFDMQPREGYALDHVVWRERSFMDILDSHVTDMLQYLNDPNMTISVFGKPDIIRKITPRDYSYNSPSNIGPVQLDFHKTVINSTDSRIYTFMSSQKLRTSNDLIIILCPRNSIRIIYQLYDYQFYMANEIRNAGNPMLPNIHAFERWKMIEYQPVQGRVTIKNPRGIAEN